jgi:protein SCO1
MRRRTVVLGLTLIAAQALLQAGATAAERTAPAAGAVIAFELQDTSGRPVRGSDLRGRWLLVFFGYTSCPDICPTILVEISGALTQLGALAGQFQPVFITVDPQRDTPHRLREYVNQFDERILPLTGTVDQIARAAGAFGATFFEVPGSEPDNYTMAHSAILTLVGPEGGLVKRFPADASANQIALELRKLIEGNTYKANASGAR